jgi:8-oxo-dGTP diphosphatase
MIQRIATKALIVQDGKLLLLREAATYGDGTQRGRYQLPGGRVEIGEPFETALKREIMEESGLSVEIGQPFYVGEWHPVIKGEPNQIIGIFFVCVPTTHTVVLSDEHDDYKWVDFKNWQSYDVMDPEDKAIARYIKLNSA